MKKPTKRLVEKIAKDENRHGRVTQLFAIAMLDYRGPVGDHAWHKMRSIAGHEAVNTIAFLTGLMLGAVAKVPKPKMWRELVPELRP